MSGFHNLRYDSAPIEEWKKLTLQLLTPLIPKDVKLVDLEMVFEELTEFWGATAMFSIIIQQPHEEKTRCMAAFRLSDFPGLYDTGISTDTYIIYEYRGKGIGKSLHVLKETICRWCDVFTLIATVSKGNEEQLHILNKLGWTEVRDLGTNHYKVLKKEYERDDR